MKTITEKEFKTAMDAVIDAVQETGEPITVTKDAKPWFVVGPVLSEVERGLKELEAQRHDPSAKVYDSPSELFGALDI